LIIAKQVFEKMLETGTAARLIVEREGLKQTKRHRRDRGRRSMPSWPTMPTRSPQYKGGKEALFGFFVGQTMKAMQGKANPGRGQRAAEEGAPHWR
jgi:aspartyl-tRNA(Asn)/glutamyl-tRNA(Gln) amidotransferase subunit B